MKVKTSTTYNDDCHIDPVLLSFPDLVYAELAQRFGVGEKIRYPNAREYLGRKRNFRKAEVRAAIFYLAKHGRIAAKPKFFRLLPTAGAST